MINELQRDIDAAELLPPVSRDSRDIQEIMRIHNVELNDLWSVMIDIFANQFIVYMTEYGLSQWEAMLDIQPSGGFPERRNEILKTLYGQRPYTLERFQAMLDAIYGAGACGLELNNDKYELWIDLSANIVYQRDNVYNFADIIVPKNLKLLFKNIKNIMAKTYIGGYARMVSTIHIRANTSFSFDVEKSSQNWGGRVRIRTNVIRV